MKKEKFTDAKKKAIAKLNLSGKEIDYLSQVTEASKATIYKAKREGKLLNDIENLEKENCALRKFIVQEELKKFGSLSKNMKKAKN